MHTSSVCAAHTSSVCTPAMYAHSSGHECMRNSATIALCWWRTLEELRIAANAFAPCLGHATCPHSTQCPHSRLNVPRYPRARSQRCVDHNFTLLRCRFTLPRSRCLLLPLSLLSRLTFLLCVGSRTRPRSQRCVDHSFTLLRSLLPLSLHSRLTFLPCVGSRNAFACSTDVGF